MFQNSVNMYKFVIVFFLDSFIFVINMYLLTKYNKLDIPGSQVFK